MTAHDPSHDPGDEQQHCDADDQREALPSERKRARLSVDSACDLVRNVRRTVVAGLRRTIGSGHSRRHPCEGADQARAANQCSNHPTSPSPYIAD